MVRILAILLLSTFSVPCFAERMATFNTGLFAIRGIKDMVPYVQERAKLQQEAIPQFVSNQNLDFIALQELWDDGHAEQMSKYFDQLGYKHVRPKARVPLFYGNGLLVAFKGSFAVLKEFEFIPFRRQSGIQKLTVHGLLAGTIEMTPGHPVHVVTIHTQALTLKANAPSDYDEVLTMGVQISQLKETVAQLLSERDLPVVVLGDFNFGQTQAPQFYSDLLALGFKSSNDKEIITWDNKNLLVKNGLFPGDESGQLDHIFFYNWDKATGVSTRRIFDELYDLIPLKPKTCWTCKGQALKSPLSDHYGLMVSWEN